MRLNLDINKLREILGYFYQVTGVKSSVYDRNYKKIMSYPPEHCHACKLMHDSSQAVAYCRESNLNAFEVCNKKKTTVIYKCHIGLSEVVSPLMDDGIIIGYIIFGQLTMSQNDAELKRQIYQKCKEYNIMCDFNTLTCAIKYKSKDEIIATAKILEACICFIMYNKIVQLNRSGYLMKLNEYIDEHIGEKIKTADLCEEFLMSKTKLYDTFNDILNMSMGEYIKARRIAKAKQLLIETEYSIGQIAEIVGFKEYNYFCNTFKKEVGVTAYQYRINKK